MELVKSCLAEASPDDLLTDLYNSTETEEDSIFFEFDEQTRETLANRPLVRLVESYQNQAE